MTLFKMVKDIVATKWLKVRCPCGREYEYPEGGYQPKTCGQFECVQKYLHPDIGGKG